MKLIKIIKICLIVLLILLIAYLVATRNRTQGNSDNAPVISSDIDEIQIPCRYTEEELLQGLTAYDVEDGYITDKILIGSFSDFTERGVSSLEYAVYDKDGNIATFNRKVVFTDYSSPVIMISDPLVFEPAYNVYSIPSLSAYLEASDKLDGDVSKHILITSEDIDFSEAGNYTVSAYVKNSFGDEVNLDLPIHILDPSISGFIIELKEPLIYVDKGADIRPESFIAAVRNEYTNEIISDKDYKLRINSDVDTSKDGVYEIQFTVVSSDKVQRGETWMTVVVGDFGG